MRNFFSIILLLVATFSLKAQKIYINGSGGPYGSGNTTYYLSSNKCDTFFGENINPTLYTCKATYQPNPWTDSIYNDIAVDNNENIWYVTKTGHLYKRSLTDTGSCSYVGDFHMANAQTQLYGISSLVAGKDGSIYAACNVYTVNHQDTCKIYKYHPSSGFSLVGDMPGVYSSGDMFFSEYRLFMTCTTRDEDSSFIYEVVLKDPKQSCYYMPLGKYYPYGTVSIEDGKQTKVIISTTDSNRANSYLVGVDIPNKKILDTICTYPFLIRGAAYYYNRTGDSTNCPYVPATVSNNYISDVELNTLNPSKNNIRLQTSLTYNDINRVRLFDLSGRNVKDYSILQFPSQLSIEEVPEGLYVLQIVLKNGRLFNKKIIKH